MHQQPKIVCLIIIGDASVGTAVLGNIHWITKTSDIGNPK